MADELNSLFSPEYLAEVRGLMGPTAQDKRSALTTGLLSTAMGLLANRSPYFGVALGNAGLYGIGQYQGALEAARQGRAEEIKGALTLRDLKAKLQQDAAVQEVRAKLARGDYNITKPGVSPATASVFGTEATPDESGIDQQALVRDLLATGQLPAKDWIELQLKQSEFGAPVQVNTPAGPRFAFPSKSGQFKTSEQVPFHQAPAPKDEYTYNPATNAWDVDQQALARDIMKRSSGAARIGVTNVTQQETEESKTVGKGYGESFNTITKSGFEAAGKINQLGRLSQLLEGVQTGKLTPATTELAAYAEAAGIKVDPNLGAKQAAESISNQLALQLRNPSGGAGMPGAMSDSDREFLRSMTPGLSKTPAGNRLIIESSIKLAQRDQEVAQKARAYRQAHGHLDEGFYDELQAFSNANPLFPASAVKPSASMANPAGGKFLGFKPAQ